MSDPVPPSARRAVSAAEDDLSELRPITELAEAIRRERPRPEAELGDAVVDLIESILSADQALDVPVAVDRFNDKLGALIDRRIRKYLNGVEIVG